MGWSIDRETVTYLVKGAAATKHKARVAFLSSVEILNSLTRDEVSHVADVLRSQCFSKDEHIIHRGGVGSEFFVLEQGNAQASIIGRIVMHYGPGDYFGELSLLRD